MKKITISTLLMVILCLFAVSVLAVGSIPPPPTVFDWEATAFNNGRRMCRDGNGYFHMVFQTSGAPGGDIYYTCTMMPAAEPPSMAAQGAWMPPINMTMQLGNLDNRYPSMDIEMGVLKDPFNGPEYQMFNTLHVVWQAILPGGTRYEVLHANIPVTNPPAPPIPWAAYNNLSNTPKTDSLVPAICLNDYHGNANFQVIHVVWQEEDINNNNGRLLPPQEDAWFSDIAYIRSIDSGMTWAGPTGGWNGNIWDNISNTPANSQMPTIACVLDRCTEVPHTNLLHSFCYHSHSVHVAYNEDVGMTSPNINVFYSYSPGTDGATWNPRVNVSAQTGGTNDAYPNIAVDMVSSMDFPPFETPYIVFMRNNMNRKEPMRTGANLYWPGFDPTQWRSFPGPGVGMYGVLPNSIVLATSVNGAPFAIQGMWGGNDCEFPTVAFDRQQNLTVNWQEYMNGYYEVQRDFCLNFNPMSNPPMNPIFGPWNGVICDSLDPGNDDLFPNQPHRKAAMYLSPVERLVPPMQAGYDEVWTKVMGLGWPQAVNAPKMIFQDGNMTYGP
jgi:hypothetical protein